MRPRPSPTLLPSAGRGCSPGWRTGTVWEGAAGGPRASGGSPALPELGHPHTQSPAGPNTLFRLPWELLLGEQEHLRLRPCESKSTPGGRLGPPRSQVVLGGGLPCSRVPRLVFETRDRLWGHGERKSGKGDAETPCREGRCPQAVWPGRSGAWLRAAVTVGRPKQAPLASTQQLSHPRSSCGRRLSLIISPNEPIGCPCSLRRSHVSAFWLYHRALPAEQPLLRGLNQKADSPPKAAIRAVCPGF